MFSRDVGSGSGGNRMGKYKMDQYNLFTSTTRGGKSKKVTNLIIFLKSGKKYDDNA
jgi:hypothetical protein